jgi:predicted esterase
MSLHDPARTLVAGSPLESAKAAAILLHGRGGSAEDMLGLAEHLVRPNVAFLVPQASDYTWYPERFLAPLAANEPYLSSALELVGALGGRIEGAGLAADRIMLLGFSQGACLALEYGARHPRRYGGLVGLSGALIGPPGTERPAAGTLDGTPVFLGCSDQDFHVPAASVEESAGILTSIGGSVDLRFYPGMGHTINEDELEAVGALLDGARTR